MSAFGELEKARKLRGFGPRDASPLSDSERAHFESFAIACVKRLADLMGCQLGPSFLAFAALMATSQNFSSSIVVGPSLEMRLDVRCSVIDPSVFNMLMSLKRERGIPYAIVKTTEPFAGKVLHMAGLQALRCAVKGSGEALQVVFKFDNESAEYHLIVADFNYDSVFDTYASQLRTEWEYPEQLRTLTQLHDKFNFEENCGFHRAIQKIQLMEGFGYSLRSIRLLPPVPQRITGPRLLHLSQKSQKDLLLYLFYQKGGVLQQLITNPFRTAQALQEVELHAPSLEQQNVTLELRALAHSTLADAVAARNTWCDPVDDGPPLTLAPVKRALDALCYDTRAAVTGDGVPKDAVTTLLLLTLCCHKLVAISLAAFIHMKNGERRLVGFVCPSVPSEPKPPLGRFFASLKAVLVTRFGLVVHKGISFNVVPPLPSDVFAWQQNAKGKIESLQTESDGRDAGVGNELELDEQDLLN